MSTAFADRCISLLEELGLNTGDDRLVITPLSGGVSSDIGLVELGSRKLCVKFALAQLKVEESWFADTQRNQAEYEWLKLASTIAPDSVPELLGHSAGASGFVMEYIDGPEVFLWKDTLLQGQVSKVEPQKVGAALGTIHNASAKSEVLAQFQNQADFNALRLEPYLLFTATRHSSLQPELYGLADMLESHEKVVVHGDISPKNIIFRRGHPVFLDAECATAGDPAFDVAFCLNHLILKALHLPAKRDLLLRCAEHLWSAYSDKVDWETAEELERRISCLLPALMLARVDGKSPVEYLDENERQCVRVISVPIIASPESSLAALIELIKTEMEDSESCPQ